MAKEKKISLLKEWVWPSSRFKSKNGTNL